MFKVKQHVRHKYYGRIPILILEVIKEYPNPEYCQYKCRYFSEGQYYSEIFYGFELELTD